MDSYDQLAKLSYEDAMALAQSVIHDERKFAVEYAVRNKSHDGVSSCFVIDFFSIYKSAFIRFGDLRLSSADVLSVDLRGQVFTRVGFDVDGLQVLVDADGRVWEWDDEVLDGPCAPSGWHYIVWVAHLVYGTSIASLKSTS